MVACRGQAGDCAGDVGAWGGGEPARDRDWPALYKAQADAAAGEQGCRFTGKRKGFDGLAFLAQTVLQIDPCGSALFVFRRRRGDPFKALHWDGQGLCLYAKRLGLPRARFVWPQMGSGPVTLTTAQVSMLLEAIDWLMPAWTARPAVAA